jgi:hypothetical protein
MVFSFAWIAFALAGVRAAPTAEQPRPQITYQVRCVQMEGLAWRETACTHLKPVARQGNATIWTAPRHVVKRLLEDAQKSASCQFLQFPKVTAASGVPAHFSSRASCQLITQVAWQEDGEPEMAPERMRIGMVATMVGRKLDQGILVQLVVEDAEIHAIHRVNLSRCSEHEAACAGASTGKSGDVYGAPAGARAVEDRGVAVGTVAGDGVCANTGGSCETAGTVAATVSVEVPESSKQEIAGEWLIPHGESLVMSFGVHTVAGKDGKAVLKERLATLDADELPSAGAVQKASVRLMEVPAPTRLSPSNPVLSDRLVPPPLPVDAAKLPMPMPVIPSRTMPQGVHADGTRAELPPLPPDEMDEPPSESSEPLPSPQKKKPQAPPKPPSDSGTDKAALTPPKAAPFPLPGLLFPLNPISPANLQFLVPIKPLSFKLPFNQRLEIEIFGRVVPNTD